MTAAPQSSIAPPDPGVVLRRSLLVWGWGHLLVGARATALGLMAAEVAGIGLVAYLLAGLADSTWYLVPFLAGVAFITAWVAQAVDAFRRVERATSAIGPAQRRSPAAAVAWLSIPLLVWGTGFWLVAANASSPSAVVNRFETAWPGAIATGVDRGLNLTSGATQAAQAALRRLAHLCAAGQLNADCHDSPTNLLGDVRLSVIQLEPGWAQAQVQVVAFERRPSRFLFIFPATELVPVAKETVLRIDLRALPAPLPWGLDIGASAWQIVNASAE